MSNPLISIILPVFNAETYLKESIDSMLHQSYHNLELIIINDGSTDRSKLLIEKYKDKRIRAEHFKLNGGLINALNVGLAMAKGEFVARMDADDISRPDRLAIQLEYIRKKNADIIGSFIKHKGGSDKIVKYPYKNEEIKAAMLFGNPMVHPSIFFNRILIDENLFQYSADWKHVEDYELWIRLMNNHSFANVPEPLVHYRISDTSVCFNNQDEQLIKNKQLHRIILDQLLPEQVFSEIELNWIENPALILDKEKLDPIIFFIQQLAESNKKIKLFDQKAFSKRLIQQFYQTCVVNRNEKSISLFNSITSELNVPSSAWKLKLLAHKLRKRA